MVRVILERPYAARANTDHHVAAITRDRSLLCCTSPTCWSWSNDTGYPLTTTQTTFKSTASVKRVTSTPSLTECPPASMKCRLGCGPTGCRWTHQRLKCFGVLLVNDNIRSRLHQYVSAVLMCCWYPPFVTSGYTSTTSVCEHMSRPLSDRAMQHYIRFGVRSAVFHNTPYWH